MRLVPGDWLDDPGSSGGSGGRGGCGTGGGASALWLAQLYCLHLKSQGIRITDNVDVYFRIFLAGGLSVRKLVILVILCDFRSFCDKKIIISRHKR